MSALPHRLAGVSGKYAWYVLALLTLLNVVNYMDRLVIVGIHDDLRAAFHFSDVQLGSFWYAFFTVHGLLLIPFGWAGDRYHRIRIAAAGVLVWSLATLGSAFAVGFLSLFLLRACIGVGEAAYGPVANVLICEVFPAARKARAIGIYNAGMFIGSCLGVGLGPVLGFPFAFELVAIPGILLGVLVLFLKVPAHRVDRDVSKRITLSAVLRESYHALNKRTLRWLLPAGICVSFTAGAMIERVVDFMKAYKGFSDPDPVIQEALLRQAALILGVVTLTAGVAGVIVGGIVADRLHRRYASGRILAIATGFALALPFGMAACLIDRGFSFYVCFWFFVFFIPWYNGPMAAVIDDVVEDDNANKAQASFACLLHIVGTGPAAVIVGFASSSLGLGLRNALLMAISVTAIGVVCCLVAARHVAADMQAKCAARQPQTVSKS